jgi:hypothetical protein
MTERSRRPLAATRQAYGALLHLHSLANAMT